MLEPKAELQCGGAVPFSHLSAEDLVCIATDPRCITDDDAVARLAPGFHRQYAAILLRERAHE